MPHGAYGPGRDPAARRRRACSRPAHGRRRRGAILGSLAATLLAGSRYLAGWFGLSVAAWGAPLALIAAFPQQATALVALAIIGGANAILDVGLLTIVARLAADEVLARVFGVLEAVIAVRVGLGAIVTPLVVHLAGTRGALAILGAVGPGGLGLRVGGDGRRVGDAGAAGPEAGVTGRR